MNNIKPTIQSSPVTEESESEELNDADDTDEIDETV